MNLPAFNITLNNIFYILKKQSQILLKYLKAYINYQFLETVYANLKKL